MQVQDCEVPKGRCIMVSTPVSHVLRCYAPSCNPSQAWPCATRESEFWGGLEEAVCVELLMATHLRWSNDPLRLPHRARPTGRFARADERLLERERASEHLVCGHHLPHPHVERV